MLKPLLIALSLLEVDPAAVASPAPGAPATDASPPAPALAEPPAGEPGGPAQGATAPPGEPTPAVDAATTPEPVGEVTTGPAAPGAQPPSASVEADGVVVTAPLEVGVPALAEPPAPPVPSEPPSAAAAEPVSPPADPAEPVSPPADPGDPASPIAEPVVPVVPGGAVAAAATQAPRRSPTRWGITLDGGFPDAAGVAVVWRPWYWLRLEAGGTTTVYASHGFRAGVSLVPFNFGITPALTFNYGRALESDWNPMLAKFSTPDPDLEPVLRRLGYQYVDAHLGLELGPPRRFVFFVRAGLTQLWTELHGLTDAARSAIDDAATSATVSDTKLTLRVPSAKVGFLIYFF